MNPVDIINKCLICNAVINLFAFQLFGEGCKPSRNCLKDKEVVGDYADCD